MMLGERVDEIIVAVWPHKSIQQRDQGKKGENSTQVGRLGEWKGMGGAKCTKL